MTWQHLVTHTIFSAMLHIHQCLLGWSEKKKIHTVNTHPASRAIPCGTYALCLLKKAIKRGSAHKVVNTLLLITIWLTYKSDHAFVFRYYQISNYNIFALYQKSIYTVAVLRGTFSFHFYEVTQGAAIRHLGVEHNATINKLLII